MLLHGIDPLVLLSFWGLALVSWMLGCGVLVRLWKTRRRSRRLLATLMFASASSALVAAILIDDGVLQDPNLLGLAGLVPVVLCGAAWAMWCRATSDGTSTVAP